MIDSGLNKTFIVEQTEERKYRFTFKIVNNGGQDWVIEGPDEMFHSGLSDTWVVDRVWYNITTDFDGGSFSTGVVSWDTTNAGTLSPGQSLYAKYLVNITESQSASYFQNFEVNDTSNMSGSSDYHRLNITKYGFLNATLTEPPNDTIVRENEYFLMNGSVTCENGECGQVTVTARYNQSSVADTAVPTNSGSPFYTNSTNPKTCSNDLKLGETCFVTWFVNSTGSVPSHHLLDIEASSSASQIQNNDSKDHLVEINKALIMDLTFTEVDFGSLDPGTVNNSAKNNSDLKYNISVSPDSRTIDQLWIRATDLNSDQLDYTIPAENMSYATTNNINKESMLSNAYSLLTSSISPGTVIQTFYWLDIPTGIYKGRYTGNIYFKANSSVS